MYQMDNISSPRASKSLASILTSGTSSAKLNALILLKETIENDQKQAKIIAKNHELLEAIANLIKSSAYSRITKASLVIAYYLVSSDQSASFNFSDMGLVSALVETLVDSDKSVSEKALCVLERMLRNEKPRKMAYGHALTMPVLVKKMFRVSDMGTEFAISAIWSICKNVDEVEARGLLESALNAGAFQKLLLLLQLGCCSASTKEKASDLLRLLNKWRGNGECIESADFRRIKRDF